MEAELGAGAGADGKAVAAADGIGRAGGLCHGGTDGGPKNTQQDQCPPCW